MPLESRRAMNSRPLQIYTPGMPRRAAWSEFGDGHAGTSVANSCRSAMSIGVSDSFQARRSAARGGIDRVGQRQVHVVLRPYVERPERRQNDDVAGLPGRVHGAVAQHLVDATADGAPPRSASAGTSDKQTHAANTPRRRSTPKPVAGDQECRRRWSRAAQNQPALLTRSTVNHPHRGTFRTKTKLCHGKPVQGAIRHHRTASPEQNIRLGQCQILLQPRSDLVSLRSNGFSRRSSPRGRSGRSQPIAAPIKSSINWPTPSARYRPHAYPASTYQRTVFRSTADILVISRNDRPSTHNRRISRTSIIATSRLNRPWPASITSTTLPRRRPTAWSHR